eukprot:4073025-Pyramimonas_sp.AAC.1
MVGDDSVGSNQRSADSVRVSFRREERATTRPPDGVVPCAAAGENRHVRTNRRRGGSIYSA